MFFKSRISRIQKKSKNAQNFSTCPRVYTEYKTYLSLETMCIIDVDEHNFFDFNLKLMLELHPKVVKSNPYLNFLPLLNL